MLTPCYILLCNPLMTKSLADGLHLPQLCHITTLPLACRYHCLSDDIHLLTTVDWHTCEADVVIHCDASLNGLGFVITQSRHGFCASIPLDVPLNTFFFYEALCIVSTILWASELPRQPHCLLTYTDSLNTVEMFNSLHMLARYNELLLFTMCLLIATKISLYVFHIPGADNFIADALSHHLITLMASMLPRLQVHLFQPLHSMQQRWGCYCNAPMPT